MNIVKALLIVAAVFPCSGSFAQIDDDNLERRMIEAPSDSFLLAYRHYVQQSDTFASQMFEDILTRKLELEHRPHPPGHIPSYELEARKRIEHQVQVLCKWIRKSKMEEDN